MKEVELKYGASKNGRTFNPEASGLSCAAQFGISRLVRMYEPSERHFHRGMLEIGFCMRGSLSLENADGSFPVKSGWFFVNRPDAPHRLSARPKGLYLYYFLLRKPSRERTLLDLPPGESSALWRRLLHLPPTFPAGARESQAREAFARLAQFCRVPSSPWTSARMRLAFLSLAVLMLETAERSVETNCLKRVEKTAETIRRYPERRLALDDLAREAFLSPTHLINQFRKATGFPPMRFVAECRIQRAKEMLSLPGAKVADVAIRCGFNSPQHFSNVFTRVAGVPPSRWRDGNSGTDLPAKETTT